LIARDKVNLDLTVLQSASVSSATLAPPDVIAQEIVDDLESALAQFTAVAQALKKSVGTTTVETEADGAASDPAHSTTTGTTEETDQDQER
jgi:type I restriction enzyme M protein